MSSVTFRNGLTITDDANPTTGLANGGHRTRFVPALSAAVDAVSEAKDWASKLEAIVFDGEYSAKEYAVGNLSATGGSAKAWAIKVASVVSGTEYSAKEYAVGTTVPAGSAKAWAVGILGVTLPGGSKSAKEYAADAAASALTALNAPGTIATSTSSVLVSGGTSKNFTVQPGKAFAPGQFVMCAVTSTPTIYMLGQIISYNSTTGQMVMLPSQLGDGAGSTYNQWTISLSVLANVAGAATLAGDNAFYGFNTFLGSTIFSQTLSSVAPVEFTDEFTMSADTAPVRVKSSGVSSIKIKNEGITSGDSVELNFELPSYIYKIGVRSNDGYFYINNNSTDILSYSTSGLALFKPYRTDDAQSPNELVRLSQLDNLNVTSIVSDQGALSGFRNYIINGNFIVNQTGNNMFVNNYTPSTGTKWSTDMFSTTNAGSTGCTFTTSVINNTTGIFFKSLKATMTGVTTLNTTGANNYIVPISTFVESCYAYPLSGKQVTISFKVKVNRAGVYPVAVRLHDTNSSSTPVVKSRVCTFNVNSDELNTFKDVSITFQMPSDYVVTPYINSYTDNGRRAITLDFNAASTDTYRASSSNVWLNGNFIDSVDTLAISSRFQHLEGGGGIGNGSYFEIANLQLEEGSVATPFENRPCNLEKLLCYRYLQNTYSLFLADYKDSNGAIVSTYAFPVQMAKVPLYLRAGNGTVNYLDATKIDLAADYRANRRDIAVYSFDARI